MLRAVMHMASSMAANIRTLLALGVLLVAFPWVGAATPSPMENPKFVPGMRLSENTISGASCEPSPTDDSSQAPSIVERKSLPKPGTEVSPKSLLSISVSYALPKGSTEQYNVFAQFETKSRTRTIGAIGPYDRTAGKFLPAMAKTCGPSGTVSLVLSLETILIFEEVARPLKVRIYLVQDMSPGQVIARTEAIEYPVRVP
jgi:hypothetical protein